MIHRFCSKSFIFSLFISFNSFSYLRFRTCDFVPAISYLRFRTCDGHYFESNLSLAWHLKVFLIKKACNAVLHFIKNYNLLESERSNDLLSISLFGDAFYTISACTNSCILNMEILIIILDVGCLPGPSIQQPKDRLGKRFHLFSSKRTGK